MKFIVDKKQADNNDFFIIKSKIINEMGKNRAHKALVGGDKKPSSVERKDKAFYG
jgi:hypothetical protein